MTRQQRYDAVLTHFAKTMPEVQTELHYGSVFQLLVAVVLSAQCTDRRINAVTPALFAAYPTPEAMAAASEQEILHYIASVSYPNAKARHLSALAHRLVGDYGGEVPQQRAALESLPGVGRKTANVVMSVAFAAPTIAVDTHVFRVSHRMGLVPESATTPLAVERHLVRHIPEELRHRAHHWLLLHGRYTCRALRPACDSCPLTAVCAEHTKKS